MLLAALSSINNLLTSLYSRRGTEVKAFVIHFPTATPFLGVRLIAECQDGQPLSIAILAGGMSRRMGHDKALIPINGVTLLEFTARAVNSLTCDLFVVASGRDGYARFGFRIVPDLHEGAGSLGGVYSAIRQARFDHCLVVACDMPLLSLQLVQYMSSIERNYDALVPVLDGAQSSQGSGRTVETLHAIYNRSCLPHLERQIVAGRLKIADALRDLRVREIGEAEMRRLDPDLRSFTNVNTPADLALVRRLLAFSA